MTEGSISTSDLSSYVLDCLFDSFCEETILDDGYIQNYDDVGKLSNKTDCDSKIIFDRYSYTIEDKSYILKLEKEQHTVLSV